MRVEGILRGRGGVRERPIDALRAIVVIEEVHKSDNFFVGQVQQPNLDRLCLHAQRNALLLLLNFDHG
jgi:hypothetical protein